MKMKVGKFEAYKGNLIRYRGRCYIVKRVYENQIVLLEEI